MVEVETLLAALKAAGEQTRLRLLAVLSRGELTVSEIAQILGQSQPRVSRHLRLLHEAQLVERFQEGTWVFYRGEDRGHGGEIARALLGFLDADDGILARDRERLAAVRAAHAKGASEYFKKHATSWDRVRDLYMANAEAERRMLALIGDAPIGTFLDLGTGTGRILEIFAPVATRGVGIDSSREMLAAARATLQSKGLDNCQVRQGDIYALNLAAGCVDAVAIHHVLHFLDDPGAAIAEAARTLRPRGRLVIVDLAPHRFEFLRDDYAHRRLGFTDDEVSGWCRSAHLTDIQVEHLVGERGQKGEQFTITLWSARQHDAAPSHYTLDVA